jgi:group I intron endonuclease
MRFFIMIGIYKITSPSGKVYVGQSIDVEKRIKKYKCIYNSRKQIGIYNSLKKYGYENHVFEVLEECDINILNERERYWQDYYNVLKKGLNSKLTTTKSKSGRLSKETINKMSKSLKGRVITKEWRENLSKAGKGRKPSKKSIDRLIQYNKKRIKSEDEKFKIAYNNPTSKIILDINTGVFYYSIADLARNINVNPSTLFDKLTQRKNYKNKSQYKIV